MKKILFLTVIILCFSCKKQVLFENEIIRGNILNFCTGKGFANVKVVFYEIRKKRFNKNDFEELSTKTDANGNFSFIKTIYKSDDYKYYLKVPSYSDSLTTFEGIGLAEFEKSKITEFIQGGTTATFNRLTLIFKGFKNYNFPTDTLKYTLEQKKIKEYLPNSVADFGGGVVQNYSSGDFTTLYTGYMGTWYITIYKKKAGVVTNIVDSIYLDMGERKTYTIEW
jgi:hypothetical protein